MKQIYFGFRCPHCAEATVVEYKPEGTDFSAAGSCGHCAVLCREIGGKAVVTVPCITCPTPHRYTVGKGMFSREGGLVLQCAYSGVDCFFAGSEEEVKRAMQASDEEIMRILSLEEKMEGGTVEESLGLSGEGQAAIDTGDMEEVGFYNPEVASDMLFLIKDMAYDNKIRCSCGTTNIDIQVAGEEITFTCPVCKRSKAFASRSVSDRARLEELSEILL